MEARGRRESAIAVDHLIASEDFVALQDIDARGHELAHRGEALEDRNLVARLVVLRNLVQKGRVSSVVRDAEYHLSAVNISKVPSGSLCNCCQPFCPKRESIVGNNSPLILESARSLP